jgi:hypothetical protein
LKIIQNGWEIYIYKQQDARDFCRFFFAKESLKTAEIAKNMDLRGNHGKTKEGKY